MAKPKSNIAEFLRGNARADRKRKTIAAPLVKRLPASPESFSAEACIAFVEIGKAAISLGTLRKSDLPLLVMAAQALGLARELEAKAKDRLMVPGSKGQDVVNPALSEARQWFAVAAKALHDLGLSPRARSVIPAEVATTAAPGSPWDSM